METVLLVLVIAALLITWVYMRERFAGIDTRLDALAAVGRHTAPPAPVEPVVRPTPPPPPPRPEPPPYRPVQTIPVPPAPPSDFILPDAQRPSADAPRRTSEEWEAMLGGSWMSKAGVFVVVIGLALLLNYAYANMGPGGRVAIGLTGAIAMLISGVVVERREGWRTFAYGLIGGGWAALYLTTFAMYAIPAAKVIDNPWLAAMLLFAVAVGMIAHSLRYRSQTVTGLAYFIAFVTLGISEVTTFSVIALIPLAASLLYVARRNHWQPFAIFGLLATWGSLAMHKDAGAPLWQAQAVFLIYWLLFEGFDLIQPDRWLLPLNALGFLVISGVKWNHAAPDSMWIFAAGSAALYLTGTVLRARAGRWRPAVTLNAALVAAAILIKQDAWAAAELLVAGEAYYVAGVRWDSRYLRGVAAALFGIEFLQGALVRDNWKPIAMATTAIFYLNRALRATDVVYGYIAAGVAALVAGAESNAAVLGRVWGVMAVAPFTFGWWRRQFDFRMQGYGLAVISAVAIAVYFPHPPLGFAFSAAMMYALVQCTLRSDPDRFHTAERDLVRAVASGATTLALAALVWRLVPGEWLGTAWLALAAIILEAGLRDQPVEFQFAAFLLAMVGVTRAFVFDTGSALALLESAILYGMGLRVRDRWEGRALDIATFPATALALIGLSLTMPSLAISTSWAVVAVVLGEFDRRSLRIQSLLVAAAALARCVAVDLFAAQAIFAIAPVIACLFAAMLRKPRGSRTRLAFSLAGSLLLGVLIFHEVSGSVLTIAWGVEGVALLATGFALRDRVLRLSGLALLAVCTGKLFFWDLRNLDTLPRIVSFIVLGLLLVAVSWIYTRFRDQVQRLL